MLGDIERKNVSYLNMAYGRLNLYMGKDKEEKPYGMVEGVLDKVESKLKTINGITAMYLYLYMHDGEENYAIQVPLYKSAGPNIIRSLMTAMSKNTLKGGKVKIVPYPKEDKKNNRTYTNATVYLNGEKLTWADIPAGKDINEALDNGVMELSKYLAANAEEDDLPLADGENPFGQFSE